MFIVISSILSGFYYIKSVQPAALEKKIGEIAYEKCARYRILSNVFLLIIIITQVFYFYFPLQIALPRFFPWDYWITIVILVIIVVPSLALMIRAGKDAGKELIKPTKEQELFGGIYEKIRHPQVLGKIGTYWFFPLILNSPFLCIFGFIGLPLALLFAIFEEKDLKIRFGQKYIDYKSNTGMFFPKRRRT